MSIKLESIKGENVKYKNIFVKVSIFLLVAFGLAIGVDFAKATDSETRNSNLVVKVEPKKVCMVNNKLFDKDQIPVEVEGKTYYGCCEMCKKTLAERAEFRVALDPVSNKEVDKAKAVIGALSDGTALYFENDENLKKYNGTDKANQDN